MWRGEHEKGLFYVFLAMVLLVAACAGSGGTGGDQTTDAGTDPTGEPSGDAGGSTTSDAATEATEGSSATAGGDCDIPPGEPFIETQSVELTDLGEIDGAQVRAAMYPHPDYDAELWSQWGQGIVIEDGRFFSAIGDHNSVDGNSYVYEYDPSTNTLTMIGDVLSYVDHEPGTWGYGKIHSQMVPGPCGEVYFSTYWGSFRDIEFEGSYTGDVLFRLDPYGRNLQTLGVPVEFHGQASLASHPEAGLVYGEAVDPVFLDVEDYDFGPFFAYDVATDEVVYTHTAEDHIGFRSILMTADGTPYYSVGEGKLQTYDPAAGETTTLDAIMPGYYLRAATQPAVDGSVYGVTDEPTNFFVMKPDGTIEDLGEAPEYTTSMALSPDGSSFYYMPGAHGDAPEWNSPLIRVDTSTGEQTTVVELNDAIQEEFGHVAGGTYNVAVSPDGGTVYVGINGGEAGSEEESFGEVFLVVIELP